MPGSEWVYVALGSNVGDRAAHLAAARAALAVSPETRLAAASTIEETEPIGPGAQPPYLNQMLLLETRLDPWRLLAELHRIEGAHGRVRAERWGPRTLDLDIVRYGDHQIEDVALTLPHPELPRRAFWRRELAELERHVR